MADELMRVQCVELETFNPAGLDGTYRALNGSGFSDDIKILKVFNGSSTIGIVISLDGVNDHDYWPPLATIIIDCQTNHSDGTTFGNGTLYVAKNQIIWGKTTANQNYLFISGFR